jgi:SRSO17 transposase
MVLPARTSSRGRPKVAKPNEKPRSAKDFIAEQGDDAFRLVRWREGTKGALRGWFAAVRVRPTGGETSRLPGDEVWLIAERRKRETKYYLSNAPATSSLHSLVSMLKARWACEQGHQQMKEELGLDHFEGRSWHGLHHHALLTMIAFAFLQYLRCRENKS